MEVARKIAVGLLPRTRRILEDFQQPRKKRRLTVFNWLRKQRSLGKRPDHPEKLKLNKSQLKGNKILFIGFIMIDVQL